MLLGRQVLRDTEDSPLILSVARVPLSVSWHFCHGACESTHFRKDNRTGWLLH